MPESLTLTYGLAAADREPADLLRLEQEPWSIYTGLITKGEMLRWLSAVVSDTDYVSGVDCGLTGDTLVSTLYVYPYEADLVYQLHTSWGQLSERRVEMQEIRELVQFRLTTEERTDYPVRRILGVDWDDDCYGPDGEIVAPPALTADRETISCASPVYGTAEVRYLCERHTYTLTAPRREEAIDNQWSAVVVGVYAGGLTHLITEMPPGIDSFADDMDAICGRRGGSGSVDWPEKEYPIIPGTGRKITEIDYCSQKVDREWVE